MTLLYLGDEHIRRIGLNWEELVSSVEAAIRIMDTGDYAQPIKPYLRFNDPVNRIIAMPAYIGGKTQSAGIKWIASFPGNLNKGLPRASSITLLNDTVTGIPQAILHTAIPSAARTAAVSGLMIKHHLSARQMNEKQRLRIGIIGFGPVGRLHYDMCCQLFEEQLEQIHVYDIRQPDLNSAELSGISPSLRSRTQLASSWQQVYEQSDLIITCTVSSQRYIDQPPAPGSLLLDVSLRDYKVSALEGIQAIIVDSWEEVCRENTDIELLHLERGLTKDSTHSLTDVVCRGALTALAPDASVLFCPMGMAVFDIAVASYLVSRAKELGIGIQLS